MLGKGRYETAKVHRIALFGKCDEPLDGIKRMRKLDRNLRVL